MNKLLKKLFDEDQNDRRLNWNDPNILRDVNKRDEIRLESAHKILSSNSRLSSEDNYHLAMILQHSEKKEDYKVANRLCAKAMNDYQPAKWLYAATLDRFLMRSGRVQKYGTQFVKKGGKWTLWNVNKSTTDAQRKELDVPSLDEQIQRIDRLNSEE